jgi:hypothetical protein
MPFGAWHVKRTRLAASRRSLPARYGARAWRLARKKDQYSCPVSPFCRPSLQRAVVKISIGSSASLLFPPHRRALAIQSARIARAWITPGTRYLCHRERGEFGYRGKSPQLARVVYGPDAFPFASPALLAVWS